MKKKGYRKKIFFWKIIKPMLVNKFVSSEKLILVENQKILMNDNEIPKTLHDFFSNTNRTLHIPKLNQSDPVSDKVNDPT